MEIVNYCIQGGTRYYAVRLNGEQIFCGTKGECARFMEIHNAKVAQQHVDDQRIPRAKPVQIRTYRQLRAQA